MLPITDILHRTTVLALAGITGWGLYTGASVHLQVMAAGRQAMAEREQQEAVSNAQEQREWELAQQATKNVKPA